MRTPDPCGSAARTERAMVLFPEPEPPAMPRMNGDALIVDGARFSTSARVLASNRMQPSAIATMSYAEYVLLEERSREKHEYLWGQVFAMSGGTPEHAALEAAVNRELANALAAAGKPCRVYSANLR